MVEPGGDRYVTLLRHCMAGHVVPLNALIQSLTRRLPHKSKSQVSISRAIERSISSLVSRRYSTAAEHGRLWIVDWSLASVRSEISLQVGARDEWNVLLLVRLSVLLPTF